MTDINYFFNINTIRMREDSVYDIYEIMMRVLSIVREL